MAIGNIAAPTSPDFIHRLPRRVPIGNDASHKATATTTMPAPIRARRTCANSPLAISADACKPCKDPAHNRRYFSSLCSSFSVPIGGSR